MHIQSHQRWLYAAFGGTFLLWIYSQTSSGRKAFANVIDYTKSYASRVANLAMSRGYRNHNPLNLRFVSGNPFNGQVADDGGYGVYDTPQHGLRAAGKQLSQYFNSGSKSVHSIVSRWAPSTENDTESYIIDVSSQLNVDRYAELNFPSDLSRLAQAMAVHEEGYSSTDYDWDWVYLP